MPQNRRKGRPCQCWQANVTADLREVTWAAFGKVADSSAQCRSHVDHMEGLRMKLQKRSNYHNTNSLQPMSLYFCFSSLFTIQMDAKPL